MHVILQFYHSSHLLRCSPYRLNSNSILCSPVSTCTHPQSSSSYMPSCRPSNGKTSSSYHQPYSSTNTPSAIPPFLALLFICMYFFFSLSVSLNPFFHAFLPTPRILSEMYYFHTFPSTHLSETLVFNNSPISNV